MKKLTTSSLTNLPAASYLDVLQLWQKQLQPTYLGIPDFRHLIPTDSALIQSPCITWILDLHTRKYVFVSTNIQTILGYNINTWKEGGLSFTKARIHPDDSARYWRLIYQVWCYLIALPASKRIQYRYNCDYRIQKVDETYVRLLEQNTLLKTSGQENSHFLLGTCTDITDWKKSEELTATIISPQNTTCMKWVCNIENEKSLHTGLLSKREKEILKLIADGYSSKIIADMLRISFHTVNTHRQKLIEKAQVPNTGGLIQFALTNNLI